MTRAPRRWGGGLLLLAALGAGGLPGAAAAQESGMEGARPLRIWLGLGPAGVYSPDHDAGLGVLLQLAGQKGPHQLTLRAVGASDFSYFPDASSDDSLTEIGLLYGRTWTRAAAHATLSAGVSALSIDGCDEEPRGGFQDDDTCTTVGVPFAAEAALQTTFVGIGLQAFANINPEASYGGLALFLQLGWMP